MQVGDGDEFEVKISTSSGMEKVQQSFPDDFLVYSLTGDEDQSSSVASRR